ncbi:GRIP and coiled-coil domain-containing protein 2-like [Aphis craccivora]|uniref:GRIP and coiled-coil domain-containing protein 2-like n=1 Tax=Aphis craccivora TaxID=307492 RepID=A0A6G0Z9P4_APHCR|nr:GRIP and coiled-coil domain-containing protein 2-like [Aphis craccivora]
MDKNDKMLGILRHKTKIYTDMLKKNVDNTISSTKILTKHWENTLSEYSDTVLHNTILSYQRVLTIQMEFKDKIIEKLQNELDECIEYRCRTGQRNLELVNTTLDAFRNEIENIHHQYQAELELALPMDLAELEVRTNENDTFWRMLKYDNQVVQLEIEKWKSIIENKHIENMDIERGRNKINTLEKDISNPKLLKEFNILIQKKDELQEGLKQFRNKLANNSKLGHKQKSHLCQSTKEINKNVNIILKRGEEVMKCIQLCQELETSEEKTNKILVLNTCENNEVPDHQSTLQEMLSNIHHRISSVKVECKIIDENNDKLQNENFELKKKIDNIVKQIKNKHLKC